MGRNLGESMILRGARAAVSAGEAIPLDIGIEGGRLRLCPRNADGPQIDLTGCLILPGLINAHDHLEFNLFPRLGSGPYANATQWATDIHRPDEPPVREHLTLAKPLRLLWGGIKNLISGVTSVLHHNPYDPSFDLDFPVRVIRRFGWSHSLAFSRDLAGDWTRTPSEAPFVIHACEGTDGQAATEVFRLDAAGVLGPHTVLVHGVALDEPGLDLLKKRGASLIWCPSSNQFTLGRTLSRSVLNSGIPIALGTDSALTAAGDLIDEIELAAGAVEAERVYRMVTDIAAAVLRLTDGEGTIREDGIADLVVLRDRGRPPAEALLDMRPEAVFVGGQVKLVSAALAPHFPSIATRRLQPLRVEGRGEWLIDSDVAWLVEACHQVLGDQFRLAGKAVAA
jgi:cytosine/adenosine deaminase-related metal-dependent hydrolase